MLLNFGKECETFVRGKLNIQILFFTERNEWILLCNQVTSEFYNDWQDNSTMSNEWILKEANFAVNNTQVFN